MGSCFHILHQWIFPHLQLPSNQLLQLMWTFRNIHSFPFGNFYSCLWCAQSGPRISVHLSSENSTKFLTTQKVSHKPQLQNWRHRFWDYIFGLLLIQEPSLNRSRKIKLKEYHLRGPTTFFVVLLSTSSSLILLMPKSLTQAFPPFSLNSVQKNPKGMLPTHFCRPSLCELLVSLWLPCVDATFYS